MSIDSVFTKLQNNRRQRYEDIAKRQAREKAVGAFSNVAGTFLGSVLSDTLRTSANNFINSAPIMNERIQAKLANKNATRINTIQDSIDRSGKTDKMYFFDTNRDTFEELAKNALAERSGEAGWRDIAANPDVYDSLLDKEMMTLAEAMAENHREAYSLSTKLGTPEEFDAIVELATKNARPINTSSFIARQIRQLVGGKTSQEFDDEALLAIQNSGFAENAKALNAFMEEYEENGNVISAYNFGKFVEGLEEPEDRERKKVTVDTVSPAGTGVLIERKVTEFTDKFSGDVRQSLDINTIFDLSVDKPEEAALKLADDARSRFDHAKEAGNDFNEIGARELYKRTRAVGIDITTIDNMKDYIKVGEIYSELMEDPTLIKNPLLQQQRQSFIDIVTEQMGQIEGLIARVANMEDPEEQRKAVTELGVRHATFMEIVNQQGGFNLPRIQLDFENL